ncbi:fatty acid desaturase [Mesorhizobium sp. BAC0120]|uniref:fatty acid desaturase n=1 Tax=Mesorhizobium sp. BAC0120 TaxID=3090670 RepID=UPI00298D3848|nr:fatty acid desaturase [Mesorhizobium sp. BAC0120]MDW6020458.1 fatty acid desaturase [Mesorhizobium sp. BAC0120]
MAERQVRRRGLSSVEWPTVGLIIGCYALWGAAGLLIWPSYPSIGLLVLGFVVALQSSLVHEVLHGHPTRNALVNEAFVFLPIGLVWPYRRFKALHLRHHADERLTDPFDDPESYYQALWKHEELPEAMKALLRLNNTMVGRLILGPWLSAIGFFLDDWRLVREGDRAVRLAWALHLAALAIVLPIITYGFCIPLWIYLLGPTWLGLGLISIRTFAEHQWSEQPEGRTIIVERSPLAFLFLNNNLHFVHHRNPAAAWYRLPRMFRERRDEWVKMNDGYVFPNYFALLKEYAFKAKEPVVHPSWRRAPELGASFRPRVRARNVSGLGTAPVPAEPPKK